MVQIVSFAHALSYAREYGIAAVLGRDVANELLHEHGLPHAGAAEEPDLTAADEWRQKVDGFQPRFKYFGFGGLVFEWRCFAVNARARGAFGSRHAVYRIAY